MLVDSQQWKDTAAHPTVRDSRLVAAPSVRGNELEDEDYDLYHFMPSRDPRTLIPIHRYGERRNAFDGDVQAPIIFPDEHNAEVDDYGEELDSPPPYSPPRSPTYTVGSDFVFPGNEVPSGLADGLCGVGYSNCFMLGLFSTPPQLARHLERLAQAVKRCVSKVKSALHL